MWICSIDITTDFLEWVLGVPLFVGRTKAFVSLTTVWATVQPCESAPLDIKSHIEEKFGYDLSGRIDDIREDYAYSVTCAGSVPQSIVAFLEADDFEGSVRNAISLGGDADTMAAIAGSIAEAFYGEVPEPIRNEVVSRLPVELKDVLNAFYARFGRGFRVR
jgi:ADP-ribosylglycohydrolase